LTSIPGVSAITAFALLIEMLELGALEPEQAASLAGLAPVVRQSGRWNGRALIRGRTRRHAPGSLHARADRRSLQPDLKAKYAQLTNAGKPAKVALTAVMRQLILRQTLCSSPIAKGPKNPLDQNGYSRRARPRLSCF
jgi:transposase